MGLTITLPPALSPGQSGHSAAKFDWLRRLDRGNRRQIPAGDTISLPNASDNALLLLETGLARISLNGGVRDLTISYLRPGGVFVTHTARIRFAGPRHRRSTARPAISALSNCCLVTQRSTARCGTLAWTLKTR